MNMLALLHMSVFGAYMAARFYWAPRLTVTLQSIMLSSSSAS